jgi:riboflavin synthase
MFTGLIEGVGEVVSTSLHGDFLRIRIRVPAGIDDLKPGSSIATDGVCITARDIFDDGFSADLSRETLDRTTLGALAPGAKVNLERSLRADARLGGHIVQGHVDATGRIRAFTRQADDWSLTIACNTATQPRLVEKGSIAVDGISLTVAGLTPEGFRVAIIPFTYENTTLGYSQVNDMVNLEFDVLAKYVERLIEPYLNMKGTP